MNFLEASAILRNFKGGRPLPFLLASSAMTSTLDTFVRAHGAAAGLEVELTTLPFGTLGQFLRGAADPADREVFVLFPWDFVPQADWRTGLPARSPALQSVQQAMEEHAALLSNRPRARFVYVPAPIPPLLGTPAACRDLAAQLLATVQSMGAAILPPQVFNLSSYFHSGNPFASNTLSDVAEAVLAAARAHASERKKVLVTDFDNTLWGGIVGEDGVEGLLYNPEGGGFPFFVYQSLLRKLRNEGALLVGVTRNDRELALAPFKRGDMVLEEADFVAIAASYNSKSAQIAQLAEQLNLNLDSFVFVDDNPLELEEVRRALPAVECVRFSSDPAALPGILTALQRHFGSDVVTAEDASRTEMYRLRAGSYVASRASGADLRSYLASLQMRLTVRQRRYGDHGRCLQLINKTNQFNLNGRRWTDEELQAVLANGGTLIGATLEERDGSHGEILACLIGPDRTLESLVLSCRVFQRRVEHAFTAWLASSGHAPEQLRFAGTPRNEPARMFLTEIAGSVADGLVPFDAERLARQLAEDLQLFQIAQE